MRRSLRGPRARNAALAYSGSMIRRLADMLSGRCTHPLGGRRLAAGLGVVACTLVFALGCGSSVACAASQPETPTVFDTVTIVLTPFLTWDDVLSANAPDLHLLASEGAIANMNAVTADPGWPTAAGGALTLSSSRWAAGPVGAPATPNSAAAINTANAGSLNPPEFGALGSALHAAGFKTAALGNADENTATPAGIRRPAALVAFDRDGRIDINVTDESLLATDSRAPFGVRADRVRFAAAVERALAAKPRLLVIDPGDLERAHDATGQPADQYAANHASAVRNTSEILSDVSAAVVQGHSLLLIVTPATDKPYYEPPYFAPIIAVGNGFTGELSSGSTQRPGLVTNLDVAPTVLSLLSVKAPTTMLGQPMRPHADQFTHSGDAAAPDQRIALLKRLGAFVGAVDYSRDLLFVKPFARNVMLLVALVTVLALVPWLRLVRPVGNALLLLVLAVPSAAWLLFVLERYPASSADVLMRLEAATLLVFVPVLAIAIVLRRRPEIAPLILSTLTSAVICVDQWSGHPIETGLFSYSIRAGWRYYGIGNEAAALLVAASIVAVGLACDVVRNTEWAPILRVGLMPIVGAVALWTIASPSLGANAGAAIWGVVAFGIAWLAVNRLRANWKAVAGLTAVVVIAVAAIAVTDMSRVVGQTHIGRFFASLFGGDFASVNTLVVRKALNNYNYLPQTPYTWLAVAIVAGLAAIWRIGDQPLARALASRQGVAGALIGVLAGGVVAAFTEDSGVVMPALMLLAGALPAFSLALADNPAQETLDPDVA